MIGESKIEAQPEIDVDLDNPIKISNILGRKTPLSYCSQERVQKLNWAYICF